MTVCEHGQLARQCLTCELQAENAELRAQLASFVLCEYCRENGKVHVAVSDDQMVDNDHVWAMVNGADVYHKRLA